MNNQQNQHNQQNQEQDYCMFIQTSQAEAQTLYTNLSQQSFFNNMSLHQDPLVGTYILVYKTTDQHDFELQTALRLQGYIAMSFKKSSLTEECKRRANIT
jgi:hypothetical protein